uniref:Uncharacterized protein n=1 Tax=Pyramimonas obovata TaxID=1411642 RepID=A0A7S0R269_9CHLO|mmetsp:Transcript_2396/g.4895  ORF Transcript_2396/g.4895 Transcript_2396/m.4895 type:complete len:337 (+) Transcript_2396:343-1353(+)
MSDTHVRADELRQVKELLWTAISSKLPPSELEMVRIVIGTAKIDCNEQVFQEVSALSEILGEVRISTDVEFNRRRMLENPSRRLIENEIRLLADNIRRLNAEVEAGANREGRKKDHSLIPNSDRRQQQILGLVTSTARPDMLRSSLGGRPITPRSPPSRPTSSRSSRAPSDAGSACSSHLDIQATMEPVQAKLNAFDIDAVKVHIVEALDLEHDLLLDDVNYFHLCLEDQVETRHQVSQPPASINELRELGTKLQQEFVKKEQTVEHSTRVNKMLSAAENASGRVGKLRSVVEVSRSLPSTEKPALKRLLSDPSPDLPLVAIGRHAPLRTSGEPDL